jgi:phage-related protein
MNSIGAGAREIRVHVGGEWRVIYVAKFAQAVYVLHAFSKKTQRTPQSDIELATKRDKEVAQR